MREARGVRVSSAAGWARLPRPPPHLQRRPKSARRHAKSATQGAATDVSRLRRATRNICIGRQHPWFAAGGALTRQNADGDNTASEDPDRSRARAIVSSEVTLSAGMQFAFVTESVRNLVDWQISEPDHTFVVHRAGQLSTMDVEFERGPSGPAIPRVGDLWIIPARQRYAALAQGNTVEYCEIRAPTGLFGHRDIAATVQHHDPLLLDIVNRIDSVNDRADAVARLFTEALANSFRQHLAVNFVQSTSRYSTRRSSPAWSYRSQARVTEFLADNLDADISLASLAGHMGMSKDRFGRMFRSTFHTTPHQFLLELRMQRAKQLLATTTVPIAEIAAQCGFPIPSHFTTTFRSRTGVTPTEYRRNA